MEMPDFDEFKVELGLFEREYVSQEEHNSFTEFDLPRGGYFDPSKKRNEVRYYRKRAVEEVPDEIIRKAFMMKRYYMQKQMNENINTMKIAAVILAAVTLINIVCAIISFVTLNTIVH